jgi:hypothetical protein
MKFKICNYKTIYHSLLILCFQIGLKHCILLDLKHEIVQLICDEFQRTLTVVDNVEAILEFVEPPIFRMSYVLGLWRLKRLRLLRTLWDCQEYTEI